MPRIYDLKSYLTQFSFKLSELAGVVPSFELGVARRAECEKKLQTKITKVAP